MRIKILIWALLFPVTVVLLGACAIVIDGLNDRIARADIGIVLGSKVEQSGSPSNRLAARLDKVVELYKAKKFSTVLVSGGFGKEGYDEAIIMQNYLMISGVPADAIIVDSNGINTEATAKNSAIVMKEKGFKSALIVTQYFHITRTRLALNRNGIHEVYSVHANFFELRDIYSTLREVIAIPIYLLTLGA